MPIKTKVRKIGNSYGIVLPKEALQALKVEEGASLYLTEAPNNTLNINPERPGFDAIMQVAEEGIKALPSIFDGVGDGLGCVRADGDGELDGLRVLLLEVVVLGGDLPIRPAVEVLDDLHGDLFL